MTTSSTDEVLCEVCETPDGEAHKDRIHPFTPPGKEWAPPRDPNRPSTKHQAAKRGARPEILVLPAPDLALRAVLINAGIVSPETLKEAEYALRIPHADPAAVRADEVGSGGDGADRSPARP